jgi:flagellar biosynthesis GTPase FlhF
MTSTNTKVDYDIFIIGGDHNQIIIDLINLFDHCNIIYGINAITIKRQELKVQIVLRYYSSISEVLHGFDIGSACVAWDGRKYYSTSMGIYAFRHSLNIVDMSLRSGTYEKRLNKYINRGYGVILPHLKIVKCFRGEYLSIINLGIVNIGFRDYIGENKKHLQGNFIAIPKNRITYDDAILFYEKEAENYNPNNWNIINKKVAKTKLRDVGEPVIESESDYTDDSDNHKSDYTDDSGDSENEYNLNCLNSIEKETHPRIKKTSATIREEKAKKEAEEKAKKENIEKAEEKAKKENIEKAEKEAEKEIRRKLREKCIGDIITKGFRINKTNPTTQKFGMVDPSTMTEKEWYGINY